MVFSFRHDSGWCQCRLAPVGSFVCTLHNREWQFCLYTAQRVAYLVANSVVHRSGVSADQTDTDMFLMDLIMLSGVSVVLSSVNSMIMVSVSIDWHWWAVLFVPWSTVVPSFDCTLHRRMADLFVHWAIVVPCFIVHCTSGWQTCMYTGQ